MTRVTVEFDDCGCQSRARMVPVIGPIREVNGKVAPTPQFKSKRPIFGEVIAMVSLSDTQQTTLSVVFLDAKGNPAKVDGAPEWLVDNPNLLALAPAADGLSCVVSAVGPLGTATVSLKADADLGSGVTALVGSLDFEVTAGTATVVTITAGTTTEQTPPEPPAPPTPPAP